MLKAPCMYVYALNAERLKVSYKEAEIFYLFLFNTPPTAKVIW